MARPASPQLTDAEQRIMAVLWDRDEASVREITDVLAPDHGLAYTTVLTTVRIMADKGYVGFRKDGRAHIYHALLSREGAPAQSLAQHLVKDDQLTLEDIEALRAEVLRKSGGEGEP